MIVSSGCHSILNAEKADPINNPTGIDLPLLIDTFKGVISKYY